jgi:hypothetical protein
MASSETSISAKTESLHKKKEFGLLLPRVEQATHMSDNPDQGPDRSCPVEPTTNRKWSPKQSSLKGRKGHD